MKDIGLKLKEKREENGVSIEEVAEDLKMRPSQIISLEEGKKEDFKDVLFLKYFIRDYAKYLGLDGEEMVDEFNEAARALYNNGNGQIGDISGMVESTYGVHILIYLGPVENLFNVTDIDTFSLTDATGDELAANIQKITSTPLSVLNTKTMFDLVYEKLMKDNVSMLEMLNLNTLKADTKITKYPSHYSDLY